MEPKFEVGENVKVVGPDEGIDLPMRQQGRIGTVRHVEPVQDTYLYFVTFGPYLLDAGVFEGIDLLPVDDHYGR